MYFGLDIKLFILLFMSLGFDWMVQTEWEATNKFTNWYARLIHSWIYSMLATLLVSLFGYMGWETFTIFWILLITHFIIDKRTIVIWWMKYVKRIPEKSIKELWWMNIAIDQWLHLWVNLIICIISYSYWR